MLRGMCSLPPDLHGKERIQNQQTQVFLEQENKKKGSQMESKGYMKVMI